MMDSVYRGWVGWKGMVWGVRADGESKASSSMHLNRKAAIACSLKCTKATVH